MARTEHVLAHRELEHTLTEQRVLKKIANDRSDDNDHANPFVVQLHWSFHDAANLYLCIDFHPGGDLATQLSRWGRLNKDRSRFYSAEIANGLEALHRAGIIYRVRGSAASTDLR
jgi:serum/glucocorticoid-regulated kinase 2